MAMSPHRRVAIVLVYIAGFWGLLPALLWLIARTGDAWWGVDQTPHPSGWVLVAAGAGLVAWAWVSLWRGARALPITALPPTRLTSRGPYATVRHPNYLGFNLMLLGMGIVFASATTTWVLAPAFLPVWILYALLEERRLRQRFKGVHDRYQRRVGFFPRLPVYALLRLAMRWGALPVKVQGAEHIPAQGPAVIVANHACYVDFLYVGASSTRRLRFTATAEAWRRRPSRWFLKRLQAIPLHRYRCDIRAVQQMLGYLADGEIVVMFPEGERCPLGELQPLLPGAVELLARLDCPVIPAGISGAYNVGPRWADRLRRRPVTIRYGPAVDLSAGSPHELVQDALRNLVSDNPQPVDLEGLDLARLSRVFWACPRCHHEDGWHAAELKCDACGGQWRGAEGFLADEAGHRQSLAALAKDLWAEPPPKPLTCPALGHAERPRDTAMRPLEPLGTQELRVGPDGVRFGSLHVPLDQIYRVTTERADTLQVSTLDRMWHFRPRGQSPFRLQRALSHWRRQAGSACGSMQEVA